MTWLTRIGDFFSHILNYVFGEVAPVIENFIQRFATDAGKLLLSAAATFALDVRNGKSMQDAGRELLDHVGDKAGDLALTDAMDAIRIHLSAK